MVVVEVKVDKQYMMLTIVVMHSILVQLTYVVLVRLLTLYMIQQDILGLGSVPVLMVVLM